MDVPARRSFMFRELDLDGLRTCVTTSGFPTARMDSRLLCGPDVRPGISWRSCGLPDPGQMSGAHGIVMAPLLCQGFRQEGMTYNSSRAGRPCCAPGSGFMSSALLPIMPTGGEA
jgi:hypothetical protein